jgi:hypothetical protein
MQSALTLVPSQTTADLTSVDVEPDRRPVRSGDVALEILRAAQAGNVQGIEKFVKHYEKPVFAFVSRRGCIARSVSSRHSGASPI